MIKEPKFSTNVNLKSKKIQVIPTLQKYKKRYPPKNINK